MHNAMGFFDSLLSGLTSATGAGALVSGAFGIGSSLLGNKAQSDANKTNMQIAQMNNEWSEKMMEKQNQYNIDQWNREVEYNNMAWQRDAEYNSASEQANRFKDAGLNPALVMGSGNAGVVTSSAAPSGNSVGLPSPASASVVPLRYDGFANAIANTVQMLMAVEKQNSDINNANKMTDAAVAEARAKVALMKQQERGELFKNEMNDITRDLQYTHMNEDYLRKVQERSNMEWQEKLIQQQVIAQDLINKNLPEKLVMELAVMASQRDLTKFNSQSEAGKMIDTMKKRGYKLTQSEEKAIFDAFKRIVFKNGMPSNPVEYIGRLGTLGYYSQGNRE